MGSSCGKNRLPNNGVIDSHTKQDLSFSKPTVRTDDVAETTDLNLRRKTGKKKGAIIDYRLEPPSAAEAATAVMSDKPKTHWEIQTICMAIHRHSVLTDLTEDAREEVINSMKHFSLGPCEVVFQEGAKASHFFVVGNGSLEVIAGGKRINILKPGDSFGEQALLHNTPRSATIRTLDKCTLWGVDRKAFREAVELVNGKNYQENKAFLESVPMFTVLTTVQMENLLAVLATQTFQAGKRIVLEGETGELLYIIKEGSVSCSVKGKEVRKMKKGEYFGEQALLNHSIRTATVIAFEDVKLLSIGRNQLNEVLGLSLQRIVYRNTQRMALEQSPSLSQLTEEQKERLIDNFKISSYQENDVVIQTHTKLQAGIHLILKGEISLRSGSVFASRFDVVGGEEMMMNIEKETEEDVLAASGTDVGYMSKDTFEELMGGTIAQISAQNEAINVLKRVSIFHTFSHERLLQLYSVRC